MSLFSLLLRCNLKGKFTLLIFSFCLPVALLVYLLITEQLIAIKFAQKEITGAKYIAELRQLQASLIDHHSALWQHYRPSTPLAVNAPSLTKSVERVEAAVAAIDQHDAQHGEALSTSAQWQAFKTQWQQLQSAQTPAHFEPQLQTLWREAVGLIAQVGDQSNLILDPDLDSYYLMDLVVLKLPALAQNFVQQQLLIQQGLAQGELSDEAKQALRVLRSENGVHTEHTLRSAQVAISYNGRLAQYLKASAEALSTAQTEYLARLDADILEATSPTSGDEFKAAAGAALEKAFALFDATLPQLISLLEQRITGFRERQYLLIGAVALLFTLSLGLGFMVIRSITAPLGRALAGIQQLARGEIGHAIDTTYAYPSSETGQLLQAISAMQHQLQEIIINISETADEVARCSAEIAESNLSLSQRTESQAASLEQTAASMEELTTTIQQNAINTEQTAQAIVSISSDSERVTAITGVIDDIAFQTNLLALNAAVEAARAGEQGRGFAVVANEVRCLAQKSTESARQIKVLIQGTSNGAHNPHLASSDASEQGIIQRFRAASLRVESISQATKEQSAGIQQIHQAVATIDQANQQNAALVEEMAAAAAALKHRANDLKQQMSFFAWQPQPETKVVTTTTPASAQRPRRAA